ncbi:MAG TPA: hypothetical protein VGJ28_19495 [Micromonosporaceae bacterium]
MDIVAQWVRTSWTKRSRGGAQATRRNAAPIGFPLPEFSGSAVHEVTMTEADDFEPWTSLHLGPPSRDYVQLEEADGRLRVQLVVTSWGMPRRWRRPPSVHLEPGEWLRWQVNFRFSTPTTADGGWSYRLETLNLAYGTTTPDLFTGAPTKFIDERAHLR